METQKNTVTMKENAEKPEVLKKIEEKKESDKEQKAKAKIEKEDWKKTYYYNPFASLLKKE